MVRTVFRDRVEAGDLLATRLGHYARRAVAPPAGAAGVERSRRAVERRDP